MSARPMSVLPRGADRVLALGILLLLVLGVTMVYSAGSILAQRDYGDEFHFLKRQGSFVALGLSSLILVSRIPYQVYRRWTYPGLLVVGILLVAVFIPGIGDETGGASRWIAAFGFKLQPSEMAKLVLTIYLAYSLEKKQKLIETFSVGILPHLIVVGMVLCLILIEPDFGTTATIAAILFAMMYVAGTRVRYLLGLAAVGLPLMGAVLMAEEYRRQRMLAFLDPWKDASETGYQVIQSWLSFQSGSWTGLGLGAGRQKLFFLPEAHTDFIFAVIAEELGFLGAAVTIGLFATIVYRGVKCSADAPDLFGRLLGTGITFLLGLQACFNMGVVTGLLPTKGLTLPFVSYGGSSMLFGLTTVGVLLNITAQAAAAREGRSQPVLPDWADGPAPLQPAPG